MSQVTIKGGVFGKEPSSPSGGSVRAILPLPSFTQVLDVILSSCLADQLKVILPQLPGCTVGAQPKPQCVEIAHGLQSVIEKGLDDFGNSAIAQGDTEKYYDSLPVPLIAERLVSKGILAKHAMCLLRHQMLPRVLLKCGSTEVNVASKQICGRPLWQQSCWAAGFQCRSFLQTVLNVGTSNLFTLIICFSA